MMKYYSDAEGRAVIRGFIEVVTHEVIQGWIYSTYGKTRDQLVLAFSGNQCVGSGKVEHYRRDLAEAGMGDGYLGFSFGITVEPAAVGSVTVKLEGSDAVLLQPGARVSSPTYDSATLSVATSDKRASLSAAAVARQLTALGWQLKHARLSQTDYDFLRLLWSFGIYERTLVRRGPADKPAVAESAIAVATDLLEAYLGADAEIRIVPSITPLTFRDTLDDVVANTLLAPVVALYSNDRVAIRAVEGSHVVESSADEGRRRGKYVDYRINAEHLILLDARAAAELYAPAHQVISMLTASPAP